MTFLIYIIYMDNLFLVLPGQLWLLLRIDSEASANMEVSSAWNEVIYLLTCAQASGEHITFLASSLSTF